MGTKPRKRPSPTADRAALRAAGRPRSTTADEAILRATLELLSTEGPERTTIHRVAERSGVARATIYLRWPGREALIAGAVRHAVGREPFPLSGDLETDIRRGAEQARAIMAQPLFVAILPLLVRGFLSGGKVGQHLTFDTLFPNRARFAQEFERLASEQGFRADVDGKLVVDLVIGALLNQLLATGSEPTEAFARGVIDVVLAGVRRGATGTSAA